MTIQVSSVYTIYSRKTCISEKWVQLWAKLSYRKTVTVRALPRTPVEYAILPPPNVPESCKGPFNWLKIPPLQKLTTRRNSTMTRIVPSPSLCQSNNSSDMRKATRAFALSNDVSGFSWWRKSHITWCAFIREMLVETQLILMLLNVRKYVCFTASSPAHAYMDSPVGTAQRNYAGPLKTRVFIFQWW